MTNTAKVKELVSKARFDEALALAETYLKEASGKERQILLQSCLISARNLGEVELTEKYYELFKAGVREHQKFEDELVYLHVEIIYRLMIHDERAARQHIERFQILTKDLSDVPIVLYTHGAILYYQLLYLYEREEYVQAIKLYNQINPRMMWQVSEQNPALYLYIHAYLASAYIHLSQWRTARHLLKELETLPILKTKREFVARVALSHYILDYILEDKEIDVALCESLLAQCQPTTRSPLSHMLAKNMTLVYNLKPSKAFKQLYETWRVQQALLKDSSFSAFD